MLGRYGKALLRGGPLDEALLEHVCLLNDLAGIAQKLRAFRREFNAPVRAGEDFEAELLFEVAHRAGDIRLGCIEVSFCCIDGAVLGHGDEIAELLESHGVPSQENVQV